MHSEKHSHCFMHFLASKHYLKTLLDPPSMQWITQYVTLAPAVSGYNPDFTPSCVMHRFSRHQFSQNMVAGLRGLAARRDARAPPEALLPARWATRTSEAQTPLRRGPGTAGQSTTGSCVFAVYTATDNKLQMTHRRWDSL